MNLDKDTGLPELPEGYVWRMRSGMFRGFDGEICESLVMEVCRKKWFRMEVITSDNLIYRENVYHVTTKAPTPENVLDLALKVHKAFNQMMQDENRSAEIRTTINGLAGTYPPKKLKH